MTVLAVAYAEEFASGPVVRTERGKPVAALAALENVDLETGLYERGEILNNPFPLSSKRGRPYRERWLIASAPKVRAGSVVRFFPGGSSQ